MFLESSQSHNSQKRRRPFLFHSCVIPSTGLSLESHKVFCLWLDLTYFWAISGNQKQNVRFYNIDFRVNCIGDLNSVLTLWKFSKWICKTFSIYQNFHSESLKFDLEKRAWSSTSVIHHSLQVLLKWSQQYNSSSNQCHETLRFRSDTQWCLKNTSNHITNRKFLTENTTSWFHWRLLFTKNSTRVDKNVVMKHQQSSFSEKPKNKFLAHRACGFSQSTVTPSIASKANVLLVIYKCYQHEILGTTKMLMQWMRNPSLLQKLNR